MKNDIVKRTKSWLLKQGYPLEMRVASEFILSGFSVIQSDYYLDKEENKFRETDVVASYSVWGSECLIEIIFVIECKKSVKGKPIVLFTSDNTRISDYSFALQRISTTKGRDSINKILSGTLKDEAYENALLKLPDRISYGMTIGLKDSKEQDDASYRAIISSVKSAIHKRDEAHSQIGLTNENICMLIFPIIIYEGPIIASYLDDYNEIQCEKVSAGTLLWRNPIAGLEHTIVNVHDSDNLGDVSHHYFEGARQLSHLLKSVA